MGRRRRVYGGMIIDDKLRGQVPVVGLPRSKDKKVLHMEKHLQDKRYNVYVDATILGSNDPAAQKRALVAYVVDGIEELKRVTEVNAQETDDAEYEAILFAIRELKCRLKQFTIFCDHLSVVSEANKQFKDTPATNPLLREIRKELDDSQSNITLQPFPINPAHTLLNEYLIYERKNKIN